jgi:ketosteroid isomerase-like protein
LLLLVFQGWGVALANESLQALQDSFIKALRGNDAQGLAACYTADAMNFPVDSLIGIGPDSVEASWDGFFDG